jgi:hypothetical protein
MRCSIRSSTGCEGAHGANQIGFVGITLVALPAWICVSDSTAVSSGLFWRLMMVCQLCAICTATITGSMPLCGWAAWAPLPLTVT